MHRAPPRCSRCGAEPPRPESLDGNWVLATEPLVVLCPACHAQTTHGMPGDFAWSWRRIEGLTDDHLAVLAKDNTERAAQIHAWADWFEQRARARRAVLER
jgi:hypothetical protein